MKYNGGPVFKVRVKICGITSLADAYAAVEAGADALGFNFYPRSPRFIPLPKAAGIIRVLPPLVTVVGLFVDPGLDLMRRAIGQCRLDLFQMCGDETDEFLSLFPRDKIIKSVALRDRHSLKKLSQVRHAGAYVIDAYSPGKKGGTGKTLDLELARGARGKVKQPLILAGGLTQDNVAAAIQAVRPYAVDVCSSVETSPGRKDFEKMARFVEAAKSVAVADPFDSAA